ncbi:MAG TPA: chemotaxis protein CheA [Terriglobales bacterium]|nr:chemotaxis protein CheA [Terriglobales bacterium]
MSFFSDERAAELRQLFFESAQELLQALNDQGLQLEQHPGDTEIVRGIRRTVHTLKGDSAACGYRELSELSHTLEDVLTPEMAAAKGNALAEIVLSAADMFDAMLAAYRGNLQPPDGDPLRKMVAELLASPNANSSADFKPRFEWSEYDRARMNDAINRGRPVYSVAVCVDPQCPMRGAALQLIQNVLQQAGTVLAQHPEDATPNTMPDVMEFAVATSLPPQTLEQKLHIPAVVSRVVIALWEPVAAILEDEDDEDSETEQDVLGITESEPTPLATGTNLEAKQSVTKRPSTSTNGSDTLRVDAERIDAVMNLVGELIIGKSMLYQSISEFGRRFPKDPLRTQLLDTMAQQSQVLNALQRSVMKIRMVPVDQLFRRFPRLVRDTAKACGKDIVMTVSGADTDLDKGILDALAEPLAHLVRNAADHGIETPQERIAAGKQAQGIIRLNAYHQANHVVLEVTDDGRGLNIERVVAKAIENGVITAEQASRLNDAEKAELVFESGVTTAERVTEISGRGVGMDVVRNTLARLKGTITIDSAPGVGTTFRLTLPLTLAIIKALLFRVGTRIFAVPLSSVIEITRATEQSVHIVDNAEVLRLREQLITLVRVSELVPGGQGTSNKFFIVIVGLGDRKFGLVVNRLVGEEELVIKAIQDNLVSTELVSGASILGDGTVVLILNLTAVVERLGRMRLSPAAQTPVKAEGIGASA